ncbi:hypothetical protein D9615_004942 [Tricholomella constricta]|uniref:CST complex subunit STN1 n=1 Tax=Tricholomella constricta TaxID=117010 RepID=A0A8H5HGM0_9AGAR|nr:hypothetical protein D9615_004942 [Tricholomella constricta]
MLDQTRQADLRLKKPTSFGWGVYEKRIRYTVDDGTAVVDCLHRQSIPPQTPVKKSQVKGQTTKSQSKPVPALPPPPKPLARVGIPVCVVGRVTRRYETREIAVDSIERCTSSNDEPRHWLEVHRLHKSHYSLSTPFHIPEQSTTLSRPSSPVKAPIHGISAPVEPATPSTVLSTPSTASSTPSTSLASSPAKSDIAQRLRHPSRLHSRDLNGNTFRIYVKHYMDRIATTRMQVTPAPESDCESDTNSLLEYPTTPTKRSRQGATDETPRPSTSKVMSTITPRPRIRPLSFGGPPHPRFVSVTSDDPPMPMAGFTLSYLRRVPELAEMAKRVVKAVAKRRQREEGKKPKEAGAATRPRPSSSKSKSQADDAEKLGSRIKRLFQSTIVQLLREGSIVLWDGPVRPCFPSLTREELIPENSGLWKSNVTSTSADSTVFSSVGGVSVGEEDGDEIALSEPESGEEAYVPVSPRFLAGVVEDAIGELAKSARPPPESGKGRGTAAAGSGSYRYGGSTKEGILAFLKKDDRWRYLSEWNVTEALEVLKVEGRAWCVGKERWELSI